MQGVLLNLKEDYGKFDILTKYILKLGTPLVFGIFVAMIFSKVLMLNGLYYDYLFRIHNELTLCFKESFGAVFLASYILQILYMAKDRA